MKKWKLLDKGYITVAHSRLLLAVIPAVAAVVAVVIVAVTAAAVVVVVALVVAAPCVRSRLAALLTVCVFVCVLRVLSLSVENFIKHFKAHHVLPHFCTPLPSLSPLFQLSPCLVSVSVYDSIIFTANKRENAYHGRVLNGRQENCKIFLFFQSFLLFFFCQSSQISNEQRGEGGSDTR